MATYILSSIAKPIYELFGAEFCQSSVLEEIVRPAAFESNLEHYWMHVYVDLL